MTNGTPPPSWPVEPTLLYIVTYYATNSENQVPSSISYNMRSYGGAIDKAKQLITDAGNLGVCTVQQVCATIVYPSVPWEDF